LFYLFKLWQKCFVKLSSSCPQRDERGRARSWGVSFSTEWHVVSSIMEKCLKLMQRITPILLYQDDFTYIGLDIQFLFLFYVSVLIDALQSSLPRFFSIERAQFYCKYLLLLLLLFLLLYLCIIITYVFRFSSPTCGRFFVHHASWNYSVSARYYKEFIMSFSYKNGNNNNNNLYLIHEYFLK